MSKLTIPGLIEAAYLHGLPTENLDTGKLEPPADIADVKWIADRINKLMDEVIGPDEPNPRNGSDWIEGFEIRNHLRAAQRQRLAKLFKGEQ